MVFDEHMQFSGGIDGFITQLPVSTSSSLTNWECQRLRRREVGKEHSSTDIMAAVGGINERNVKDYVGIGVDIIVTSSLLFCVPSDMKAEIIPI